MFRLERLKLLDRFKNKQTIVENSENSGDLSRNEHYPSKYRWRTCEELLVRQSSTPDTWSEKFESLERINSIRETNENFDWCNYVNGWEPAVYMSYTSQNFRLFHGSNLSVLNFRIFLLMYPGSPSGCHRPKNQSTAPSVLTPWFELNSPSNKVRCIFVICSAANITEQLRNSYFHKTSRRKGHFAFEFLDKVLGLITRIYSSLKKPPQRKKKKLVTSNFIRFLFSVCMIK